MSLSHLSLLTLINYSHSIIYPLIFLISSTPYLTHLTSMNNLLSYSLHLHLSSLHHNYFNLLKLIHLYNPPISSSNSLIYPLILSSITSISPSLISLSTLFLLFHPFSNLISYTINPLSQMILLFHLINSFYHHLTSSDILLPQPINFLMFFYQLLIMEVVMVDSTIISIP